MLYRNILFVLLFITTACFGKEINLYDQPNDTAKVLGKIDSDKGIIPIFSPKDKTWIKVGDPNNGNVGWIKSSEISSTDAKASKFNFSQEIISTGKEPQGFVMQFGQPFKTLSPEESQALAKKIQLQQETMQKNMQKMMNEMFKNTGQQWIGYPMVMPIFVVPKTADQVQKK